MKIIYRLFFIAATVSVCVAGSMHEDVIHNPVLAEGKTLSKEILTAEAGISGTMVDNVGYIIGAIIRALLGEE
ncbi:hypothetical protein BTJ40_14370 [Microbulbifer sp. A4B17]|uniref:hypothetical protein n=1 Tax=Microbulbifer sp. A4B17 TaxID=359370 RepID=UPI000D52D37F|nr:hypothetical protein [Microbulbifer sp. A4B17]AWF81913.1 hypothetical protein BTJ40_14370 [Microbulbifer sp. A4B17]